MILDEQFTSLVIKPISGSTAICPVRSCKTASWHPGSLKTCNLGHPAATLAGDKLRAGVHKGSKWQWLIR